MEEKELRGLTSAEAEQRKAEGKVNTASTVKTKSIKRIFIDNICTVFNGINVLLFILLMVVGSYKNLLFIGVVLFNTVIGIVQEIRSKKSVDKLTILTESKLSVLRDGEIVELSKDELVLDDIILLSRGNQVPAEILPESIQNITKSDKHELTLAISEYKTASDEMTTQINTMSDILKKYDDTAFLAGEASLTQDMIDLTSHDFQVVNIVSIVAIFIIIMLVTNSISLPVILIAVIESAIFINLRDNDFDCVGDHVHALGVDVCFIAGINKAVLIQHGFNGIFKGKVLVVGV